MNYEADRDLARTKAIHFKVCTKPDRGRPWETVAMDLRDLRDAMNLARRFDGHHEVGILAMRDDVGFIYWTSKAPDLLNSSVIGMDISHDSALNAQNPQSLDPGCPDPETATD